MVYCQRFIPPDNKEGLLTINILASANATYARSIELECAGSAEVLPRLPVACQDRLFSADEFTVLWQLLETHPESSELLIRYKMPIQWSREKRNLTTGSRGLDLALGNHLVIAQIRVGTSGYEYLEGNENSLTIGGNVSVLVYDTCEEGADPEYIGELAGFTLVRSGKLTLHDMLKG